MLSSTDAVHRRHQPRVEEQVSAAGIAAQMAGLTAMASLAPASQPVAVSAGDPGHGVAGDDEDETGLGDRPGGKRINRTGGCCPPAANQINN